MCLTAKVEMWFQPVPMAASEVLVRAHTNAGTRTETHTHTQTNRLSLSLSLSLCVCVCVCVLFFLGYAPPPSLTSHYFLSLSPLSLVVSIHEALLCSSGA